ncbi:unnamed protein product [Rhizophagus irregularis]|nr:unnamed protein product [Rhizophagus irregularis]
MEILKNIEIIGRGVLKAGWVNRDMCIAIKGIKLFSNADDKRSDFCFKFNFSFLKFFNLIFKVMFYEISKDPTLGKYLMILKYANQEGIIHRDLHSNNVLVHDHTYHQNS